MKVKRKIVFHPKFASDKTDTSTEKRSETLIAGVKVMDNFLLHFSSRFICFGWKMKWDSLNLLVESKKLYLSPETSHRLDFFEHNKGLGPFSFRWVMNHVPIFQVPVVAFEPEQCKSWLVIEDLDVEIHFGGSKHTDQNVTIQL